MARLWSRSGCLAASALLGACANIIGLSDYEIDPSLDQGGSSVGKGGSNVGGQGGDAAGAPAGGTNELPQAGTSTSGTSGTAGMAGGGADGGTGGSAPGCVPSDCDDEIDCTVDTCADGECLHAPDDSLCTADADECVSCQQGIGCLATPITVTQLLANPSFDEATSDWEEVILDTDVQQVIVHDDPDAHSAGRSAWWEAAAPDAPKPSYADLLQPITLPAGTVSLRVSGVYKMLGGVISPADDFTKAGLYEGTDELLAFHNWWGNDLEQTVWTSFEYEAPPAKLKKLVDRAALDPDLDLTFDIYGFTRDTRYFFDTLSLEARSCPAVTVQ